MDGYGEDGVDCWCGGECGGGDVMCGELGAGDECWVLKLVDFVG